MTPFLEGEDEFYSGEVEFTVTCTDEGSGIDSVVAIVDGDIVWESQAESSIFMWDTSEVDNGERNVTIMATDQAGNTAQFQQGFEVENPEGGFASFLDQSKDVYEDHTFFFGLGVAAVGIIGLQLLVGKLRKGKKEK